MITLRNELLIQIDLNSNSEWYLYCPWSMDILLPASSGIGPGKYSQSGTGFLLNASAWGHGQACLDMPLLSFWTCGHILSGLPCPFTSLGCSPSGLHYYSRILTLQLSWHFSSCTGLFGFRHTAGQAVVSRVSSYLRLVMQYTICLYVFPKYS